MALDIDITEDALYQEGKLEGKEEAAFNMLKKGMTVDLINEITHLSVERIAELRQQLEAKE